MAFFKTLADAISKGSIKVPTGLKINTDNGTINVSGPAKATGTFRNAVSHAAHNFKLPDGTTRAPQGGGNVGARTTPDAVGLTNELDKNKRFKGLFDRIAGNMGN